MSCHQSLIILTHCSVYLRLLLFVASGFIHFGAYANLNGTFPTEVQNKTEGTCLTGWLAMPSESHNSCLKITTCSNASPKHQSETPPETPRYNAPTTQITQCPALLQNSTSASLGYQAAIMSQTGDKIQMERVPNYLPDEQDSSLWYYGWSTAQGAMALLHFAKALQKVKLLKTSTAVSKNAFFLVSYMVGAVHHLTETPMLFASNILSGVMNYFVHTGMLVLSMLERIADCSCCSQYKNGHNTMIGFHILVIAQHFLW